MYTRKGDVSFALIAVVVLVVGIGAAVMLGYGMLNSNNQVSGLYGKAKDLFSKFWSSQDDETTGDNEDSNNNNHPTHLECQDQQCVEVEGQGSNAGGCSTEGDSCTVGDLVAAFSVIPTNPITSDLLRFDAESSEGDISLYEWDFGDGKSKSISLVKVNHSYSEPGTYTVKLTVHDSQQHTNSNTYDLTVNSPEPIAAAPIASFDVSAENPGPGQKVQFTDTSSDRNGVSDIVSRTWDFGDGETSSVTDPEHTYYGDLGDRKVTLTVEDKGGLKGSISKTLHVKEYPTAVFSIYPKPEINELRIGDDLTFDAQASSDPESSNTEPSAWTWDITGTSTTNNDQNIELSGNYISHTFTKEGTYDVILKVTSADGDRIQNSDAQEFEILPTHIEAPTIYSLFRYTEGTIDKSTKIRFKIRNEDDNKMLNLSQGTSVRIMDTTDCGGDQKSSFLPVDTPIIRIAPNSISDFLECDNLCFWPLDKETKIQVTIKAVDSSSTWYKCVTCQANRELCGPINNGLC